MPHHDRAIQIDARNLSPALLRPPVSKSDAQRALALAHAAHAPHLATLDDPDQDLPGDVLVMRRGLALLREQASAEKTLDCHDGGAPFRILLGLSAVTPGARVSFTGTLRLGARPHRPLLDALRATLGPSGLVLSEGTPWPLFVASGQAAKTPRFTISARESSQFATSLLISAAANTRRENRPWTVSLDGPTASPGYLSLSLDWLRKLGFSLASQGENHTITAWHAPETAPQVPGDWSSLGYLLLAAWRSGGEVSRVDLGAAHPDRAIVRILEEIGLQLAPSPQGFRVLGHATRGLEASGAECPDLLPTLAALACVLPGPSVLREVSILRGKESDRVAALSALAHAGGATINDLGGDALEILPGRPPLHAELDSQDDHRVAMSAATLAVLCGNTLTLRGPDCVAKSFPGFWRELSRLGLSLHDLP
jgi:3-phosphoshikimate 1-carboxyvinyltransferase